MFKNLINLSKQSKQQPQHLNQKFNKTLVLSVELDLSYFYFFYAKIYVFKKFFFFKLLFKVTWMYEKIILRIKTIVITNDPNAKDPIWYLIAEYNALLYKIINIFFLN